MATCLALLDARSLKCKDNNMTRSCRLKLQSAMCGLMSSVVYIPVNSHYILDAYLVSQCTVHPPHTIARYYPLPMSSRDLCLPLVFRVVKTQRVFRTCDKNVLTSRASLIAYFPSLVLKGTSPYRRVLRTYPSKARQSNTRHTYLCTI